MSEIKWDDNAKAAVREFYRWANARFKSSCSIDADVFLKEFTTRTQQKTVADAYEEHNGKWPFSHGIVLVGYSPKYDHFFAFGKGYSFIEGEYQVCTREQFEAYAKEQEAKQEGEEWNGEGLPPIDVECEIKHKDATKEWAQSGFHKETVKAYGDELFIIAGRNGNRETVGVIDDYLFRAIKPTLTKAEAWDELQNYTQDGWVVSEAIEQIQITHDIT